MIRKLFFATPIFIAVLLVVMVTGMGAFPSRLKYFVTEEVAIGSDIGLVMEDLGISEASDHNFKFLSPLPSFIAFNASTSRLTTAGRVDREEICNTEDEDDDVVGGMLDERAREGRMQEGGVCCLERALVVQQGGRSEVITLSIHIRDINDHQPTFLPNNIHLSIIESTPKNSSFKLPRARDLDGPAFSVASYFLETEEVRDSDVFALDTSKKDEVSLVMMTKLDREEKASLRMRVVATDAGPPRHSGYLLVKVEVLDSNDNSPVFEQALYEASLPEDAAFMTLVAHVAATDADLGLNAEIIYTFSPSSNLAYSHTFDLNNSTGEILLLGKLDREETSTYHLSVLASDRGVGSIPSEASVVLNVLDVNDHAPKIIVNTLLQANANEARISWHAGVGAFVGHVVGSDQDEGRNGRFNCSIDSGYFHLKPISREEHHLLTSPFFPNLKNQKNKHQILLNIFCQVPLFHL